MASIDSKTTQTYDDNLETFSLVWLDAKVNTTEDNRRTQQKLREIINHLKTFDDQQQCHEYILSLSPQDRLILIVSGRYGRQLVHQIHQLRQLSSVYVYCMDKQANEQWANNFTKVKSVIVKLDDLVDQIQADQKSRMKVEEPLSVEVFKAKENPDQSTTGLNGHIVHSLLLIDVLIRMKSVESDKQQLISLCKNEYKKSKPALALIRQFENEYSADTALRWYTQDSFLHKILNKALRVQNIDLLFLLRFVIGDIYRQLKQNQCQSPIRVYRGQIISDDELNTLRHRIGELIAINSFFSASLKRHKALEFLNRSDGSNDLHQVFFEIDADPNVVTSEPFADLTPFSAFPNECEVLFMIGSVFRLIDVRRENTERIWIIQIELCGDGEHDLKQLFHHMKKEYGDSDSEASLRVFGDVLRQMGKYTLAEKMYRRLLNELPSHDPSLPALFRSLGLLDQHKSEYDSSLRWFQTSLKIYTRTDRSDYIYIGGLYNSIGESYRLKGDNDKALEYYNKAVELFQQAHDENHPSMAHIYNNIALVHEKEKRFSKALTFFEKTLVIDGKYLPSDHPDIAMTCSNIGGAHFSIGEYDFAMQHYERSLKMRLKSLPSEHPDIAMSHANIGDVHEAKREWKRALACYEKAATIYRHSLPPQHPNLIRIEKDIQRVSSKSK